MKTSRFVLISLVAVATASVSFAGTGLQYWKSRSAVPHSVPAPAEVRKAEPCASMKTPNDKVRVKCTGSVAEGIDCKRHCSG